MHEIGVRETVNFLGLTFNIETLKMTWLAMAIVIIVACLATRNLKAVPQGWQLFVEMIIEWLHDQIDAMMGRRGRMLAPLIVGLFMFLLASNLIGLVPLMASPTNDLNTTLGLALMVVVIVHCLGLYFKGGHYIAHFFQPTPVCKADNACLPSIRKYSRGRNSNYRSAEADADLDADTFCLLAGVQYFYQLRAGGYFHNAQHGVPCQRG